MKKVNCILKLLVSYEGQKVCFFYRVISRFKADRFKAPMTTKREDRIIDKMSLKHCFDTETSTYRAFCVQTGKSISWKNSFS